MDKNMSKDAATPPPSEVTKTSEEYLGEFYGEDYWDFGEAHEEEEEIEDIYYDTKEFISKPYLSEDCTLPEDIIQFDYSFGYDCQRLFNLSVIDTSVLIFASGNLIHFFNTNTGKKWFRRCYSGCGIGHIAKNPVQSHIAVGEKGENPLIIIYEWPSFEIVTILKDGTKTAYSFLNYSPDGELLCSQGCQPDYMLTIWNWRKHKIMLRYKAYGQTVFNSRFSLYIQGHLTSSGISHIKFWKINRTFTGLKLLGELGRFGKSEICNIIGFLALPDEKVVSGCEWGNILVWDAGLIRVEVFRRGKNYCHEAPITQFIYNNGELITVAMDGTIKIWYYETIELADPPEEDKIIEVEPIFEFEIGDYYHKAKLLIIVEADPETPNDFTYFAQDGNGGIWKLELSTSIHAKPPAQIFYCHAGKVCAIQCSPFSPHLASLGEDGRIFIYDYQQQVMIMRKEFMSGGCSLVWLPLEVEDSGCILVIGFSDGVIRMMCVSLYEHARKIPSPNDDYINLVYVSKPHTKAVNVITINPKRTILVTGSEDLSIFVYQIKEGSQFLKLVPIGFIPVTGEVSHCSWKPNEDATILVSCKNGTFCEIELPQEARGIEQTSYLLDDIEIKTNQFVSIKSEVRRNLKIAEIQADRQARLDAKRLELEKKAEETGVSSDVETILEALQEEMEAEKVELPEIYIPKIPNPILFASYVGQTIWLSMGGFDAGFMYEYDFQKKGPVDYKVVIDAEDTEITSFHFYHNNKYLLLGMNDGKIRVVRVNPEDHQDLSNYWSFSMHDNDNGAIRQICFNYNYSFMFTCGNDGNVFSYKFTPENYEFKNVNIESVTPKGFPTEIPRDIDDRTAPSLEQAKNKTEQEEKMKEANAHKRQLTEVLKVLEKKYEALLRRNSKLPKSQQLTREELIIDERINKDLNNRLEEEMNKMKFKFAWQLEKTKIQYNKVSNYFIKDLETHALKVFGIENKEMFVETFRLKKLGEEFDELKKLVIIKMEEKEAKGRAQARIFSEEEIIETIMRRPNPVDGLLKQIMVFCEDYKKNIKLRRLLRKYRERKDRLETKRIEWHEMMKKKPNPEKQDPEDAASIEMAKETIGDYQLKTAPDYKVPKDAKVTTIHVFDQLLKTKEEIFRIKMEYNQKVLDLRQKKKDMIKNHQNLRDVLLEIAKEIPKEKIRHPPNLPTYAEENEYPEKKFQLNEKAIDNELHKRFKSYFKPETPKKKEIRYLDKEYEMLILEKKNQKLVKVPSKLLLMKYSGITGSKDINDLEEAGKDDQTITPWEKECKKLRVIKRLYEQNRIIDEMESDIKNFDEEISRLKDLKYRTEVDAKFLELHLLTLHQEVLILKKFEAAEEEKEGRLFGKLREKHEMQKKMNEINNKVEGRNREIRKCEEEIKNLVTMFHATIADNKFYDFLRRIFKKKYRPPKIKTDDSESESESSSTSEEEDAKSLDSKDLGPLRLDENVCPPGCDPQLYDWTIAQRSARHTLEITIMEEKKQIELSKKDYELLTKKIKVVEAEYNAYKEDLEEYMREKQRNLNEVETVIIMNLNQIQNFRSENEIEKISESVVFSSSKLTRLYKRVGELEKDIQQEKQRHEKNRQHFTRIKIDVKHMKEMIVKLTKDIDEAVIRKFGMKVDMDDIEESLLKRLVGEMRSGVMDLERSFEKKLQSNRQDLIKKENQYTKKLQDNTERYNLLTVLQEEKIKIQETIKRQDKYLCKEKDDQDDQEKDFESLRNIMTMQEQKINELKQEIAMLKLKSNPKPHFVDEEFPDVIQTVLLKSCQRGLEQINVRIREEIRDMHEEAEEIIQDAREGNLCGQDAERMKILARDMINKLPMKCQEDVIKRLTKEENVKLTQEETDRILKDLITNLKTDSFVTVIQIVKETIDSMIPQLETMED